MLCYYVCCNGEGACVKRDSNLVVCLELNYLEKKRVDWCFRFRVYIAERRAPH
jgi:hypothetical protein